MLFPPRPQFHMAPVRLAGQREVWLASQKDSSYGEHLQRYTQRGAILSLCEEIGTAAPGLHPTQWVRPLAKPELLCYGSGWERVSEGVWGDIHDFSCTS